LKGLTPGASLNKLLSFEFTTMTWIVGTPTVFGYAILVSDVQVTFTTRSGQQQFLDCLQKIYPVSKSMLGGFAGSVKIGFRILSELQYESSKLGDDQDWDLETIANSWWPMVAKEVFGKSEAKERDLGSQVILAAAHPSQNNGAWPQTDVYSFSSPDFKPVKANYRQVASIGLPNARYVEAINKVVCNFTFMQSSMAEKFGPGSMLAFALGRELENFPLEGVSSFFQVGIASRAKTEINNFIKGVALPDGTIQEPSFPITAQGLGKFIEICKVNGIKLEAAIC